MLEKKLTSEFHRVAGAIEPPAGLYPAERIRRIAPRRRAFGGVGPVTGTVVATAVIGLVWYFWPEAAPLAPAPAGEVGAPVQDVVPMLTGFPQPESMQPGEVVEHPAESLGEGRMRPRQRGTAYTVEQLAAMDWPVPTYKGPAPDHHALLVETFRRGLESGHLEVGWQVETVELRLGWQVEEGFVNLALDRPQEGGSTPESPYQAMARKPETRDPAYEFQPVTLKGVGAWGIKDHGSWVLTWRSNGTSGHLWSKTLPLDELVRIAESMPFLQ